jgi:signal transduction histidine kinase
MGEEDALHLVDPAIADDAQLRAANEQLYAHSLELATRNKTLLLLRQLYQISIQTLDPRDLAEKIVSVIRDALGFELVCIFDYDAQSDSLQPIAFDRSARLEKAVGEGHPLQAHPIPNVSKHPFVTKLIEEGMKYSNDMRDLWSGATPEDVLARIADCGHVRTMLAYPLRIDGQVTDVLVMCFNREYAELTKFEIESLENIKDVAAVALDRARVYQKIQGLNTELTEANNQQVTLIHFITHQLKGFVAKSRNIFAMILEGDYGQVPETMKPLVEEGFASSTKGAQTIQEILNASNIKSGKVSYSMQPFNLSELISGIISSHVPSAETKGVALTLHAPAEPVTITGDRMQLENAFKNLVDNAIKYTPQGSIEATLANEGTLVRFSTKDTGVGITPEDMQHLFTEGGHGAESLKINVDSTGFGLYIVKNIIEAHGGKVWAESEGAGKGSTFIVELPTTVVEPAET